MKVIFLLVILCNASIFGGKLYRERSIQKTFISIMKKADPQLQFLRVEFGPMDAVAVEDIRNIIETLFQRWGSPISHDSMFWEKNGSLGEALLILKTMIDDYYSFIEEKKIAQRMASWLINYDNNTALKWNTLLYSNLNKDMTAIKSALNYNIELGHQMIKYAEFIKSQKSSIALDFKSESLVAKDVIDAIENDHEKKLEMMTERLLKIDEENRSSFLANFIALAEQMKNLMKSWQKELYELIHLESKPAEKIRFLLGIMSMPKAFDSSVMEFLDKLASHYEQKYDEAVDWSLIGAAIIDWQSRNPLLNVEFLGEAYEISVNRGAPIEAAAALYEKKSRWIRAAIEMHVANPVSNKFLKRDVKKLLDDFKNQFKDRLSTVDTILFLCNISLMRKLSFSSYSKVFLLELLLQLSSGLKKRMEFIRIQD